ncbi:hypothetical protein, partial [Achromobacter marplatensis]|uniref:hypothetical protein n=1 Tax=Achromobacter marplatensis TaxID=470868 RepID=UPI0039EED8F1
SCAGGWSDGLRAMGSPALLPELPRFTHPTIDDIDGSARETTGPTEPEDAYADYGRPRGRNRRAP